MRGVYRQTLSGCNLFYFVHVETSAVKYTSLAFNCFFWGRCPTTQLQAARSLLTHGYATQHAKLARNYDSA